MPQHSRHTHQNGFGLHLCEMERNGRLQAPNLCVSCLQTQEHVHAPQKLSRPLQSLPLFLLVHNFGLAVPHKFSERVNSHLNHIMARFTASLVAVSLLLATPALAVRPNRVHPTRSLQHAPDGAIDPSVKLSQTAPDDDHIPIILGLQADSAAAAGSPGAAASTRKLMKTGNGAGRGGHDQSRERAQVQSSSSLQPPLAGVAAAAEFAHMESAAADRFAGDRSGLPVYARDSSIAAVGASTAVAGARKLAASAAPIVSVLEGHACFRRQPTRHLS